MIDINKKTGINLKKGSSISLSKNDAKLQNICVGLNWGCIETKAFFGLMKTKESVDLDGSVAVYDNQNNLIDLIYYGQLASKCGAINHSGDDRVGDENGDDGYDNEVIQISLPKINPAAHQIIFFLTSFKGQDFATIPFSKIRIFEGNTKEVKDVVATFNLSSESQFQHKVSMVMGKLVKGETEWSFLTIGEATSGKDIDETLKIVKEKYL